MDKQLNRECIINRLKQLYFLAAFVSLFTGIVIYFLIRDTRKILLFHFFPKLSFFTKSFISIKTDSIWTYMLLYNISDGLWCLSALLFIRSFWLNNRFWHKIYSRLFIAIAIFFNVFQLFGIIPGTFDVLDIVFMCLFAFLESIIFYLLIRRRIV